MVETVAAYLAEPGHAGFYIDATVGSGGHTAAIIERAGRGARVLAVDRDIQALERARMRLSAYGEAVCLAHGCFADLAELAARASWPPACGIVMDLGLSSDQLENPARGFSFLRDGPLDMRMDTGIAMTAADLLADMEEKELSVLFRDYGEERFARRIARRIVRERRNSPIVTTGQLASLIASVYGTRGIGGHHPATRCFQALRIAVNQEMEQLDAGLEAALRLLRPGGRLAVLSYHSLEDRRVKTCFRKHAGRSVALAGGGSRFEFASPLARILTRRPLTPDAAETACNPRARSAKVRVIEKEEVKGYEQDEAQGG